jgi:hypothetical protein
MSQRFPGTLAFPEGYSTNGGTSSIPIISFPWKTEAERLRIPDSRKLLGSRKAEF